MSLYLIVALADDNIAMHVNSATLDIHTRQGKWGGGGRLVGNRRQNEQKDRAKVEGRVYD